MRLAIGRVVFTSLLLGLPGYSVAEEVLDQSFLEGIGSRANFGGISYAQTFTVGVGGTLSRVIVEVIQLENVSIQILETENGVPTTDPAGVLASVPAPNVPFTPSNVLVGTDLSAFAVVVEPGDVLAVAIVGGLDGIKNWRAAFESTSETYPLGGAFKRVFDQDWVVATTDDFNFETYVDVSVIDVPGTGPLGNAVVLLALLGLGAILIRRRAR